MSKYRPELIELKSPVSKAAEIEEMLNTELAKPAKLKRNDFGDQTTFSFYPTKGEYFLISVKLMCLAGNTK